MENFTPLSALGGGALIGVAAAMLILLNGRIAGVSGIIGGLFRPAERTEIPWRIAFVAGIVVGPMVVTFISRAEPVISIDATLPVILLGGLLVGFGTRLGAGCTSGHGVCGVARLSPRSLVATAVFMGIGFATATLISPLLGA